MMMMMMMMMMMVVVMMIMIIKWRNDNEKPRTPTAQGGYCNEATQSRSSPHSPTHQTHNKTKIQS
jgi:hypothetical protein